MGTIIGLITLVFIFFLLPAIKEIAETTEQSVTIWAKNQKIDNQKDIQQTIEKLNKSLEENKGWRDISELSEIIENFEHNKK